MTFGLPSVPGEDVAAALMEEWKTLQPRRVVIVASPESRKAADDAARSLKERGLECDLVALDSAHDLEESFRKVNGAIERLIESGVSPGEIAVNYTSGTKMMGSGAALSSVFHRCVELRYLTGLAPKRGRERRLITTQPAAVFAYQDLLRGKNLILEMRFSAARHVLEGINDALLNAAERKSRASLLMAAEAYEEWDSFHPARFLELYPKIDFQAPMLAEFARSAEGLEAARALARETAEGRMSEPLVVDLYNNGLRRFLGGAADDAGIRIYRALEVLAQWTLRRDFKIDTDDVDPRRIPPRDRVTFEAMRSVESGIVKIGLRKSYELLMIYETGLGRRFSESKQIQEFLARRDHSILAHGLAPMEAEDARKLFAAARELFVAEIPEFDKSCRLLQFPWLAMGGGEGV